MSRVARPSGGIDLYAKLIGFCPYTLESFSAQVITLFDRVEMQLRKHLRGRVR